MGAVLLAAVVVGPLVVPLPPVKAAAVEQLADPDSRFLEIEGLRVHFKTAGSGRPAFVLLHGFGASTFSWREVMAPLAQRGTVIAFDRPGFGLTSRPFPGEWQGENPYRMAFQVRLLEALLDRLGVERAILIGNSAGGTVATHFALAHPERVQALVQVDAAIYSGGGVPGWLLPLLETPQARRLGPVVVRYLLETRGDEFIRLAWFDPGKVTPAVLSGYRKPTQVADWDRALWELTLASRPTDLASRLGEIRTPTLVVTGAEDRIVPTEQSVRLAGDIPGARLAVFPRCGHLPQEECPGAFLRAVDEFLETVE